MTGMSALAAVSAACVGVVGLLSTAVAQEYRCHSSGERYTQGEIACVRGTVARCEMHLNNSSWTFLAEACTPGTNPRVWTPQPRGAANSPGQSER
jgi:hypothetical protein